MEPTAAQRAAESWEMARGVPGVAGFDPALLHTRATDSNGHGDTKSIRMPPYIAADLAGLVGQYPEYRSISDVARDCLVLGIYYRTQEVTDPALRAQIEIGLQEIHRDQVMENRLAYLAVRKTAQDKLQMLMIEYEKIGAHDQMAEALDEFEVASEDLAEPFRSSDLDLAAQWRQKLST